MEFTQKAPTFWRAGCSHNPPEALATQCIPSPCAGKEVTGSKNQLNNRVLLKTQQIHAQA